MITIENMLELAKAEGYYDENSEAKVCQDIVLKALAESPLSKNATIKGGVVMRGISKNERRATQDMDIDFIRYSLSDESILMFISKLNCLEGIHIEKYGDIEELKQQDYHGKRVYIRITDNEGKMLDSKIDLGVHNHLSIEQEEFCFDIVFFDEGANLLINTKEQMFVEKLRSLLKFGVNSTRYKDVFDMCYLIEYLDLVKYMECMEEYIFRDSGMRENSMDDVLIRIEKTFSNQRYIDRLSSSRKNWLEKSVEEVCKIIVEFLRRER